ncbi:DUF2264 domain-containing protein [Hymenobacter sp. RP-2-7]|uniref:DUF2264 domain-containing protein n=1 Tax=Hymenobacter polaris TaxID=2682546 RepID=A0A7Y0AEZ7_9BACT|nr:DUF2264 domain-containing protein [Hymenobacter polaris]NML65957.1 DUF2264 domain-containing protein [Hymenobacter polaris]
MRHALIVPGLLAATLALGPARAQTPAAPYFDTYVAPAATKLPLFAVQQPDRQLSPFTGMTRRHWQDAARYLLSGAFSYVHGLDDPMQFPKQPGKTYPRTASQVPTEKLEGLCRTLFMAAPLLKEEPDLTLNGVKVADYYRHQLALLVDPQSVSYIQPRAKDGGPSQNLVEFGGLSVALFAAPEILWDPLPQATKDQLAATMLSYGDGPTVPQNWRYFNIFILSFYQSRGYQANTKLLEEYLQKQLTHYRGQGWYDDAPTFDYYSMWAFQLYGKLWSHYYGQQHYPQVASQLAANFAPLQDTYPYQFGRDGTMLMWGRSISYRFGAVVPFPLMGLAPTVPGTNFGWMRRIASGALLQFLQNPDFLQDNVPTLGFYGAFEPAVQAYSCRGSVYWLGKAFLGLLVPASSPFWTATENEGPWVSEFKPGTVFNKFEAGPNILVTDYPNVGAAELRDAPHQPASDPYRGNESYDRLSYNTAFPWQADGPRGEVAMNYVFKQADKWEPLRFYTFKKYADGVYYRTAELETNKNIRLRLADMPLPNGILRVDQNASTEATALRLGHYALPNLTGTIKRTTRKVKGHQASIIDNGTYQLALVPLAGWDRVEAVDATGLHPAAKTSTVLDAVGSTAPATRLYATLLLWKKSGAPFTDAELLPVRQVAPGASGATATLADGRRQLITFSE